MTRRLPAYVNDNLSTLSPLVFQSLAETEVANHTVVWSMALSFLKAFPGAWDNAKVRYTFVFLAIFASEF